MRALASLVQSHRQPAALTCVSDDDLAAELTMARDVEPGRDVLPGPRLPQVTVTRVGRAEVVRVFLDATRLGPVARADSRKGLSGSRQCSDRQISPGAIEGF
jgi:hypothetical protein